MTTRSKRLLVNAGVLIALANALGAFGTHALKPKIDAAAFEVYQTAVLFHFFHALGLLGIGVAIRDRDNALLRWAVRLILTGTVFFSGSLYLLTFGAPRAIGVITPIGGALQLAGWLLFAFGVARPRDIANAVR